ncbi:AI-2E family transporter [Hyphococcus sp.]|jgi:predicted PurR-regulated permease PerM|uniref:AI-2E family transporter n=1 Tax=Hyphococcus sp. TaxID=2038636 RepID=UPI003D0BDF5F
MQHTPRRTGAAERAGAQNGVQRGNFAFRVLFIIAATAVAFALYKLSTLVFLIAGAIVIAVIIHLIADPLCKRLSMPPKLAVFAAVLFLLAIMGGAGYLFGSKAADQFDRLAENLPQAIGQLQETISRGPFGRAVSGALTGEGGASAIDIAGFVRSMIGGVLTSLVYLVSTATAGVIFAMYPEHYRDGALKLLPPRLRPRVRDAVNLSGKSLKGWLVGQLIAMAIIGTLTSLGLMVIGLPSWLALGLVAGLAQFVPVVGPILSALPGLILAASIDVTMLLHALIVYVGVQQLESNFITPFVMRQTASIPMALTVFSIIGFGMLFGGLGALLATPITVAIYVLLQKLYIEDEFGDDLNIHGEKQA